MTKQEFIESLRVRLSGLPSAELEERLAFYSEMIDDQIEEGISEEDAVSGMGPLDDVASRIIEDVPLVKIAKEKIRVKRRLSVFEIILLVLGSPIWLSLLISAFAIVLSLFAVLWSVIISLWSVFVSFAVCSVVGVAVCPVFIIGGNSYTGIIMLAAGLLCAGLSIFAFFGCKAATKGALMLTKKITVLLKKCFIKKEGIQ